MPALLDLITKSISKQFQIGDKVKFFNISPQETFGVNWNMPSLKGVRSTHNFNRDVIHEIEDIIDDGHIILKNGFAWRSFRFEKVEE